MFRFIQGFEANFQLVCCASSELDYVWSVYLVLYTQLLPKTYLRGKMQFYVSFWEVIVGKVRFNRWLNGILILNKYLCKKYRLKVAARP